MSVLSGWRAWLAGAAFLVSAASWVYRYVVEYSRWSDVWFYILVPLVIWLLLLLSLSLTGMRAQWARLLGVILLLPTSLLWGVSVLVGIYGLKIH